MKEDAKPWDAVFDRIIVRGLPDWVSMPPATDAELDQIEAQLGSPLPDSYRAFLKRFGPGSIDVDVRLMPLSLPNRFDLALVEETIKQRTYFAESERADWLGRVVYFGYNGSGDPYVWDPKELAESRDGECCVYRLRRHDEGTPERRADSLWEFIRRELELASERWDEAHRRMWGEVANEFTPAQLRQKERPNQVDVKLWLASNNHTVRDLALSIRDAGHTDAFPILADALQEAGCANADLLDSCRTGDPDIDGKWVLQVLLGKD